MSNAKNPAFFENVAAMVEQARRFVGRTADLTMCVTYFEIGRMIVEEEQGGKARAEYGKDLLVGLAAYLSERVGKGFSKTSLKNARTFHQIYSPLVQKASEVTSIPGSKNQIGQALPDLFTTNAKNQSDILKNPLVLEFLGMEEKAVYSESDLETAIIDHKYSLYLPGKELLQQKLTEWVEEFEQASGGATK